MGIDKIKKQRIRERVPFKTEALITLDDKANKFTNTRDVSMSGLFIETEDVIPHKTEGKVELILTCGDSKISIKSKFSVTRVIDPKKDYKEHDSMPGFGISLFDFEGNSNELLYNVIRHNRKE